MLDNVTAITFANTDVHKGYQREFERLYTNSFQRIISYTEDDIIGTDFYNNNMEMFQYKKYFGYFLWKPYIIWKTLQTTDTSQVLYCDANLRFTRMYEVERAFQLQMQKQGMFFVQHEFFTNRYWTKRDAFILMDADNETYWDANQVWTPLMGFSNTFTCLELLDRYMHYCQNPQIVTESENKHGENLPGFREHRWEQSVMSILWKQFGLTGIPDTIFMSCVTKEYSPELMKMKEEINANPMAKSL